MLDTKKLVVGTLIGGIAMQLGGYLIFDVAVADFYEANRSPQLLIRETPLRWAAAAGDLVMAALITLGIVIRRADNPTIGAGLIQPLRSEAEIRARTDALSVAIAWRKIIWRQAANDEDERIDRLVDVCTRLCDGDTAAGKQLATKAIWNPG